MQIINQPLPVAQYQLIESLLHALKQDKTVLWLISGGSNIQVAVNTMERLSGYDEKLHIMLLDERFGPVGHEDSNWQQLLEAGFSASQAVLYPVLQPQLDYPITIQTYAANLRSCFKSVDVVIGLLGMGADGHTAGILPRSPACEPTDQLVVSYQTAEYIRITTTFAALQHIDIAYCLAYGENKKDALIQLRDLELPLAEQPIQILKQLKQAYVYNDQVT
ncbi:MAG: hypothetical protein NVS1B7_7160 [Candidatus Saccharimonadales bacterium]